MKPNRFRPPRIPVLLALPLLPALGAGCTAPAPSADATVRITASLGSDESVRFSQTGGPDDEPGGAPARLPLAGAVRLAITTDPEVQAAIARVRIALADARQARLLPNPVVSVSFRYPEGGGKPAIEAGLVADLLSLVQRPRRASAADHRLRAASAAAVVAALDVVARVQETYAAVQGLDAQLQVLEQRRAVLDRLLALTRSRLEAGEVGRLDVLALEARRAALAAEVIEKAGEQRERRLELARMIGRPSDVADFAVSPWGPDAVAGDAGEPHYIAAALRHRPEVQAQVWELAALGDDVALAGLSGFDGAIAGLDAEREDAYSLGPALSTPIPLFDWGQARRARAEAARVEARHKLTGVRRQVIEEVRRSLTGLRAARAAAAKVRTESIPLAEQRREQAEAAYKLGAADVTAVLLAEQDLQETRARLVELEQRAVTAHYRLLRAVGGPAALTNATTRPATTEPVATTHP